MYTWISMPARSKAFCIFVVATTLSAGVVAAQRSAHGTGTSAAKGRAAGHSGPPATHTSRGRLVSPAATTAGSAVPVGVLPSGVLAARRVAPLVSMLPRGRVLPVLGGYGLASFPYDAADAASAAPTGAAVATPRAGRAGAVEPSSVQPLGLNLRQPGLSPSGTLQLDIEPRSAQLYVDGFAAGAVDQINAKGGLRLTAGWHRLEFRARGYETPAVNVTIETNQTMIYHLALRPSVQ